jgi:hypothetical protein
METCFIIQPFDKGKFDQRYTDVFEPAIKAAGLDPYRVDRDPSVRIPIEQIEEKIRSSKICFAEITVDNPNVWYELGYAFACGKDVVMVTEERQRFPFDIQHRHVLTYQTSSKSDYEKLEINIKDRLIGLLGKQQSVNRIIDNPLKESEGLKPHELTFLLLLLENQLSDDESVSVYLLKNDMEKAGFNSLATSISVRELKRKGLIETKKEFSFNNEEYLTSKLTNLGEEWIHNNQDKIEFRKSKQDIDESPVVEDELPF